MEAGDDFEDTAVWDRATLVGASSTPQPERRLLKETRGGYESIPVPSYGVITLGRRVPICVPLDDRSVSRRHAEIVACGDRVTICDLHSRHGTFLNGVRLKEHEPQELCDGDRFRIGDVRFKFEVRYSRLGEFEAFAGFRREVELALQHVEDTRAAAVGVLAIVNEVGIDIDRLHERLSSRIRSSDVLLATDKEVLVLARANDTAQILGACDRLTRLARTTIADVGVGFALHPFDGPHAETLIETARAAANGTRPIMLKVGHLTLLVADPAMQRLYEQTVPRIAAGKQPVVITGETGVGKELVARYIHERSARAGCLVPVNCAAIPAELIESEFFGHERGAFTGAGNRKPGYFEEADGGTLFLDEVADLSPAAQAKLLRALEDGEVRSVGGRQPSRVDVRVICATHRDLEAEVAAGRFREDLYYRLYGAVLSVPPLRARSNEILPLATHFLREAAENAGRAVPQLSDEAIQFLLAQAWPGNVRELRRLMEYAAFEVTTGVVSAEHLAARQSSAPPSLRPEQPVTLDIPDTMPSPDSSLRRQSNEFERRRMLETLAKHGGNKSEAAHELGMPRTTFITKLKKLADPNHGLDKRQSRPPRMSKFRH